MVARIEIHHLEKIDLWIWQLIHDGNVLISSDPWLHKGHAVRNAERIKRLMAEAEIKEE